MNPINNGFAHELPNRVRLQLQQCTDIRVKSLSAIIKKMVLGESPAQRGSMEVFQNVPTSSFCHGKASSTPKIERLNFAHIALSLFVFLVAIYSLTYSGTFTSDDEHILASRSLSMAFDAHVNNSRVYGNSRLYSLTQTTPIFAAQAENIEPGLPFIGSLLARLAAILGVGLVQSMFLVNIWVTALTAVVVFGVSFLQTHSKLASLVTGLFFGLGTMAWVYSNTYFRDSLAMLFLAISWGFANIIIKRNHFKRLKYPDWVLWIGLVFSFSAGVLTKNTVFVAFPVIVFFLIIQIRQQIPQISRMTFDSPGITGALSQETLKTQILFNNKQRKLFLIIMAIFLSIFLWAILVPPDGIWARFSLNYYLSLFQKFSTIFFVHFFESLAGSLFSPGKSIFLFSPVLLLSVPGIKTAWKSSWPAWTYLFLLVFAQTLFYDHAWNEPTSWGLRFLLPAIPLLIITSAPSISDWIQTIKGKLSLIFIGLISAFVQLTGVLPPMNQYVLELMGNNLSDLNGSTLWKPQYSAIIWHFKWIAAGKPLDVAIVRGGVLAIPIMLGFLLLANLAVLALLNAKPWLVMSNLALSVLLTIAMLFVFSKDPAYYSSRQDFKNAHSKIAQGFLPGDLVLIKSYGTPAWFFWMNWDVPALPWTSLPFFFPTPSLVENIQNSSCPETMLDEMTKDLFEKLPNTVRRVWLLLPEDSPGASLNLEVRWLSLISTSYQIWNLSDGNSFSRLYLFKLSRNLQDSFRIGEYGYGCETSWRPFALSQKKDLTNLSGLSFV